MLSMTTRYALKALVHLARAPAGTSVLGHELARRADIPSRYLSKIMLVLRNAGLVDTTRGLGGGYRLSRPPDQIFLEEAVKLFEASCHERSCLLGESLECSDRTPCSAHKAWKKLSEACAEFLNTTTVEDIADSHRPKPRDRAKTIKRP